MAKHRTPPMEKSDEAKPHQLDFARESGESYVQALNHMVKEVADDGGETRAGDYIVAYAIEKAEGMYWMNTYDLNWQEPEPANIHIEISVRDGADNRFIPGLNVRVTLLDPNGERVGSHEQPFVWHPWLYHYGRNWTVHESGKYTLEVEIEAAGFPRHDKKNGQRFAETVNVEFKNVKIDLQSKSKKTTKTKATGQDKAKAQSKSSGSGGASSAASGGTSGNASGDDSDSLTQIWVSPHDGDWRVHEAGNDDTHAVTRTQAEAIEVARKLAKEVQGELIVQGQNGQIRQRNTYAADPHPPKG